MLSMLIDMHMLLAPFVLILQMHTDMGDERGIRLRCICLGRAAPRGSRMRGMGRCGKGSESRIARSSLSTARSRCLPPCDKKTQKSRRSRISEFLGASMLLRRASRLSAAQSRLFSTAQSSSTHALPRITVELISDVRQPPVHAPEMQHSHAPVRSSRQTM